MDSASLPTRLMALVDAHATIPERLESAAGTRRVLSPFEDKRCRNNLARYLSVYDEASPPALVVGLNPGIHGQMQTGIPFTDNPRLAWYTWLDGLAPSDHRRIEQSSRLLYEVFAQAAPGARGRALHASLMLVNCFPHCVVEESRLRDGTAKHPDNIQNVLTRDDRFMEYAQGWLRAFLEAARPPAVIGLGDFATGIARPLAKEAGARFEQAPHPRALMYEKSDGPRPRRSALVAALQRATAR